MLISREGTNNRQFIQSPGGLAKPPGHAPAPSELQQADNSATHLLSLPAESEIQHESEHEIDLNLSHKVLDEQGSVSVPGAGSTVTPLDQSWTLPVGLAQHFPASLTNNHISPLRLGKMMTMGPVKSGPRIKERWILKKTKQKVTNPTNLFSLEGPAAKMARVMGTDTSTEVRFLKESIKKSKVWEIVKW